MYRNATTSTSRHVLVNNNYYPYGLLIADSPQSNNRLKFQGKELQTEVHLNTYDFHARMYDPVKVITWQLDPLASEFYSTSPYSFLGGNPLKFIDPTGTSTENWRKKHGIKQKDLTNIYKAPKEYNVDTKTGTITQVSNKGGNTTDYFNIGTTSENGNFLSNQTLSTERGGGTINSFRFIETDKSTISSFIAPDEEEDITGFFLEPSGPSTTKSGQNQRIPKGEYYIKPHSGNKFKSAYALFNSQVPKNRYILIHGGTSYKSTRGCLVCGGKLLNNNRFNINDSRSIKKNIYNFIENGKYPNMKLSIFNVIPNK